MIQLLFFNSTQTLSFIWTDDKNNMLCFLYFNDNHLSLCLCLSSGLIFVKSFSQTFEQLAVSWHEIVLGVCFVPDLTCDKWNTDTGGRGLTRRDGVDEIVDGVGQLLLLLFHGRVVRGGAEQLLFHLFYNAGLLLHQFLQLLFLLF